MEFLQPPDKPDSLAFGAGNQVTDSGYAWYRLLVTLVIAGLSTAGLWTVVSLMPSLEVDFGLSRSEASFPYMATIAGMLIGSQLLGRASDRHGILVVMIGASATVCVGYATAAIAPNFKLFLVAQVVVGIGTAAGFSPLLADISHWFRRHRGIAISVAACGSYLSGIFWPAVAAKTLVEGDWRDVYFLIAFSTPILVIPLSFLLRRRVPHAVMDTADRASAERSRATGMSEFGLKLTLASAGLACCIAMAMPQIHIVALCSDLGFGPSVGSEILSVMLTGGIVSRLVCGVIADRIGAVRTLLIGSGLQMVALILYISADGLTSLYIVSLVFGLAQGGMLPCYPMIVREYLPARRAGAVIGFVSTTTQSGMAIGGWMSGWIYDLTGSYSHAFMNGIVWNVLNLILIASLLFRMLGMRRSRVRGDVLP